MDYNLYSKTNNFDLQQGKKYKHNQKVLSSLVNKRNLDLIQLTTSTNLGSFYEGMQNQNIQSQNNQLTEKMMELQNKFNTTLQQYTDAYRTYLTQLSNDESSGNIARGKNVKDSNGRFYYVNHFGYARGYSQEAWSKRHSSCPSNTPTQDTIKLFHELQKGADMGVGQPCNLEGNIIKNESNNRADWVDEQGVKHWFPNNEIFENAQKNHNCPPTNKWISVTNEEYNAVPSGSNMTMNSTCTIEKMNMALWNRILQLNDTLIATAQQLYNEATNIENKSGQVHTSLESTKQELMKYVNELQKERLDLENIQNKNATLSGRYQDLQIDLTSKYMGYMAWTIGAITLTAVAFHHITK
jgi:hypothetical protein